MSKQRHARIEIITIGREILDGRVVDTNSVFLAESLKEIGLVVRSAQRVDDEVNRISESFELAHTRADFVLVTGGLGPTQDDLTAEACAQFLKQDIVMHPEALAEITQYFKKMGREMLDVQKKQALLPQSVKILTNPEGTAPGFACEKNGTRFFFMPGVPKEMKRMFKEQVRPRLPQNTHYQGYQWATHFTSEGELQKRLTSVHKKLPRDFEITYRTRFPENHIGLFANTSTPELKKEFEGLQQEITSLLDADVFSSGRELLSLEEVVIEKLKSKNLKISTVESCTGGLVYHRLTNISGSSDVVVGSVGVYSNAVKVDLGVNPRTIEEHGAVSKQVAKELAANLLTKMKILFPDDEHICVSTTGIAGPSGGSPDKPVGLCHLALTSSLGEGLDFELRGRAQLSRLEYKNLFSQKALDLVRVYLK